jgi:hypothetical protein
MSDTKKGLNDITRDLVAAKSAGDQGEVDYLTAVKGLFERHPQLLEDSDLIKKAIDRDNELRPSTYYPERYEQIADELDGIVDPVAEALANAVDTMNADQAEAVVRLLRTGRVVPVQTEPLPEDGPDDQAAIGIMGSLRAPSQVLLSQVRKMKGDLS